MKNLQQLENELNDLKAFQENARHSIRKEAEEVMRCKLTRSEEFLAMLKKLEESRELTCVENDEYFHRWIRVDFSKFIDEENEFQRELFQGCLDAMETNAYANFKDSCLTTPEGPCIAVNWSPSRNEYFVYDQDSGKEIVSKKDALDENGDIDEAKTCALIEAHMEKTGYFPSVISVSGYDGSPNGYVNMQKTKGGAQ